MRFEFSAGGVVYKKQKSNDNLNDEILILLAKHSFHHGWVFPKGLIGDKEDNKHERKSASTKGFSETREEAAVREVKEETGADAKIIKSLTPVTYWYKFEEEKIKKTVYYFLMQYLGGDISIHDDEMEEVEWLNEGEVEKRLTYPSDKKVWREAKEFIV
jgi:8-oxo-dGTP diphosphatase